MARDLTLWESPFEMLRDLFDDNWGARKSTTTSFGPTVDVEETEGEFLMNFDLPGLKKEDIHIDLNGAQLTVSGERKYEKKEGSNYSERAYGKFSRSFTLPQTVNSEKVEAHYQDGVLTLTLPKSEKAKAKKIEVKEGSKQIENKTEKIKVA